MAKEENVILNKTFDFACEILDMYALLNERKQYVLAKQVCGSGTSIGANVREAQRAVSKADFINKMGIALKEAEETEFWFAVIEKKVFKIEERLHNELKSIIKIITSIINTSRNNT